MAEAKIIGLTLLNRNQYVRQNHGEDKLREVFHLLPKETAEVLRLPLSVNWYPLSTLVSIDRAIVKACLGGEEARAADLGQWNLEQTVRGLYRFLFRFLEPVYVVRKASSLWSRMVSEGALEVVEDGPRALTITLKAINPIDPIYCHTLCGSFRGTLQACGLKDVKVEHPQCVLDGAAESLFKLTW